MPRFQDVETRMVGEEREKGREGGNKSRCSWEICGRRAIFDQPISLPCHPDDHRHCYRHQCEILHRILDCLQ